MKTLRLLIATLLVSTGIGFAQTVSPTNMVATYNAAQTFLATLSTSQSNSLIYARTLTNSEAWSNLPIPLATRNGLAISNFTTAQVSALLNVLTNAVGTNGSFNGAWLVTQMRYADSILAQYNSGGYGSNQYYIAFVGAPSTNSPWLLQFGGHHLAYNISFNTTNLSATPFFNGVEPKVWTNSDSSIFSPLTNKFAAVVALRSTLTSSALLSGTYSDIVFGANGTGNHDNYPQAYPTNNSTRGVCCTNLSSSQIAQVKAVIEAWVTNVSTAVSSQLLPIYESDLAMSQTYVGYSGSDATMATAASYVRIDGPRVWIEFICQNGIVFSAIHFHTIWRDKLSDYGSQYGVCTTNIPVTIATQPTNRTATAGSSTTFTVAASGTAPFVYQWYKDSAAISGATNATYNISSVVSSNAGTYYAYVLNNVGTVNSTNATLTVSNTLTLNSISDRTINPGYSLAITNTATDSDSSRTLTFSLPAAPTNAAINSSSGILAWRPLIAQANSTNAFSVVVADNGSPSLSATQSFSVFVNAITNTTLSTTNGSSSVAYTNGTFQFTISGAVGPDYIIQGSTNLVNWLSLVTNTPTVTPFTYTNSAASNFTARFFRILLGP